MDATSTSTAFTVQVEGITELRDGVFFWLRNNKVTSASGWTLNVNGLGAKPCYNASGERVSTGFAVGRTFPCWYDSTFVDGGCWRIGYITDANTTYAYVACLGHAAPGGYLANSDIGRYKLLFQMGVDTVTPLTSTANSTGTTKTMLTDVAFDPFGEIFYYNSTTAVAAGGRAVGTACYYATNAIDLRQSLNCGSTLTAYRPIYLKVVPQGDGTVKLATGTNWAQELPDSRDGYWYIFLGRTSSTYQMSLYPYHPVYRHDGVKIVQVTDTKKPLSIPDMAGVHCLEIAFDKTAFDTATTLTYDCTLLGLQIDPDWLPEIISIRSSEFSLDPAQETPLTAPIYVDTDTTGVLTFSTAGPLSHAMYLQVKLTRLSAHQSTVTMSN